MNQALEKTPTEEAYVQALEGGLPSAPEWLSDARQRARDSFLASGLPHRRIEEWKFTDLRNQLKAGYPPLAEAPLADVDEVQLLAARSPFAEMECARAIFVDGVFRAELSSVENVDGMEFLPLSAGFENAPEWVKDNLGALQQQNALAALNTAFAAEGAALRVTDKVQKPLELVFVHTVTSAHTVTTRNLIVLEEGASIELLETHMGRAAQNYVTNVVSEVTIGDNAQFEHVKVQMEGVNCTHLSDYNVALGANASVNSFVASSGAGVSRNQVFAEFKGEHSTVNLSGAIMMAGTQHCDTTLEVDHAVPNCISREMFKLVLDDTARGVFQGKVMVKPSAQKTDGKQMAQALLLSETAEFDAKPELEIFADDVVCGHGATAGEMDEELLFYLRARGIPYDQAMALLIAAFVGEALEEIENEDVREAMNDFATMWLKRREEEH
ncbi:MAG: Fe-S cluster assembly protein SufD [Hyphomicrobiales bacterium]